MPDDTQSALAALEQAAQDEAAQQPRERPGGTTPDDALNALQMAAAKERAEQGAPATLGTAGILMGPAGTALEQAANLPVIGGPIREFAKSAIQTGMQMVEAPLAGVSAELRRLGGQDRLAGKELPAVQAERDRIAAEQAGVQARIQAITNSGTPDTDQLMALSSQNTELERMKNENNEVLASGQKKPVPSNLAIQAANVLGGTAAAAARGVPAELETALPTTEQLDQSVIGKLASGLGSMTMLAPSIIGPEVEIPSLALMAGGAQYEDALRAGADENTAENAALLGGISSLPQSLSMLPFLGMARKLGGMTPMRAIGEISKAGAYGAPGAAGYQVAQNMVAVLSGYDPNRPLGENVYEQIAWGAGLNMLVAGLGTVPGLARYARGADLEVRTRPPPLPEGAAAQPVQPAAPPPGVTPPPLPTAGAPAPGAEAAQVVGRQAAQTPEQLLASEGAPGSVDKAVADAGSLLDQVAGVRPTEPTVPAAPPPAVAAPAPIVAPAEVRAPAPAPAPAVPEAEVRAPAPAAVAPAVPAGEARPSFQEPEPPAAGDLNAEKRARRLIYDGLTLDEKRELQQQNPEAVSFYEGNVQRVLGQWGQQSNQMAALSGQPRVDPIEAAYNRVRSRQLGSAVYISDLAKELGMPVPELQQHLAARQQLGSAMLEPGNWPIANEEQRAAAVPGRNAAGMPEPKLTVRFPQPGSMRGDLVERDNPDLQRRPSQADVKAITNQAQDRMGLDEIVHYVPNTEALPERVKKSLTSVQRDTTAQTVWDNSMHELWVVGDRFDSVGDLQRALIQETQGRMWRDVADINFIRDPSDTRLGHYDIGRDRPVLNTDALMRTNDPFGNASRTAIHEVAVHKGISRLYANRESQAYVQAMNALQRNFDRNKLNDVLAQEKGFRNLNDMAAKYGYQDYESNPRHQHALTEELAGAYSERFRNREEIENNAPRWYQSALRSLTDGIRRRFGVDVSPLDMQHLLADSMGALRTAKYAQPGHFMPEQLVQAKLDQLASIPGGEELERRLRESQPELPGMEATLARPEPAPAPPAPTTVERAALRTQEAPAERANIGNLFVAQRQREVMAGMRETEGARAQPPKLAAQGWRDLLQRMQMMEPDNLLYTKRGEALDNAEAQHLFHEVYRGDIHTAMTELMREQNPTPVHQALREIVDREINRQIDNLHRGGFTEVARGLQLERDQWNQKMQERVTGTAQELQAQSRFTDGPQQIGKLRDQISRQQRRAIKTTDPSVVGARKAIGEQVRIAAQKMVNRLELKAKAAETALWRKQMADPTTLTDRYIRAVAEGIDANFGKAGFNDADRPMLQNLFNTFQQRIQEQIREGVSLPEAKPGAEPPTATEKIRNMLSNYDILQRTWDATVDQLKTENPNSVFFANLERGLAEPIGDRGVRAVIGEQNSIGDLIYKHYSTQDRVGTSLARSLTDNLGLAPDMANRWQQSFDTLFRRILSEEQAGALQRILDAVPGKGGRPAKGEVARLVDILALGGFNNDEHVNILAPRFKMAAWTPEIIQGIKDAGDMLQQIRDSGNDSPALRDKYEAQIADLLNKSQTQGNIAWKRIESLWMSSLVTGLISHLGYAIQNGVSKILTSYTHALETGDIAAFGRMHLDALAGFGRALSTDIPYIMRTGISPVRELHTPGEFPYRSFLESVPFEGRLAYLNNYKNIGRMLMALETFTIRGTQYAMERVVATRLAHDMGYHGADAERFASQGIYGTEEKIQQARREAIEDQTRWGFDDKTLAVRQQEILDKLRSESDNPDTAIADRETEALRDAQGEATRIGMHAALREDVPGGLGVFSRLVQNARAKYPAVSFIMPFNKLPANLVQEWLAWTPLGVWRGRDRFTGGTRGIEGYYGTIPGFEQRVASGEISERELRSMAYEQMVKGLVGTAAIGALGTYMGMNKDQADPWFWATADGPSSAGGKAMARAEGFSPYTIKMGNLRFSYQDSPLKGLLGILGASGDYMRYDAKADDAGSYFGSALLAGAMHMGSITFDTSSLQGLANLAGMFGPGVSAQERGTRFENLAASMASGLALIPVMAPIPVAGTVFPFGGTAIRQAYRMIDPRQFEAHDPLSIAIRNIPVLNGMFLEPKMNVFGEPVTNSPLARLPFLPIGETGGTLAEGKFYQTDPVWQYIEHTGLHLQLPGYTKKIDGQAISPNELHVFHEAKGKELKGQLAEAIQDPDFTSQPIDEQNKAVKDYEKAADEVGVEAVLDYRAKHGGGAR